MWRRTYLDRLFKMHCREQWMLSAVVQAMGWDWPAA
jgi:hypothetical protein